MKQPDSPETTVLILKVVTVGQKYSISLDKTIPVGFRYFVKLILFTQFLGSYHILRSNLTTIAQRVIPESLEVQLLLLIKEYWFCEDREGQTRACLKETLSRHSQRNKGNLALLKWCGGRSYAYNFYEHLQCNACVSGR